MGVADVCGVAGDTLKMNLWYVLIGIVRRVVPASWLFTIMRLRGDGSLAETSPEEYYADCWRDRLAQRGQSINGKRVLEVGSGRYARMALQWLAAGAKEVTLVDLYATSVEDAAHRALLEQDCMALGLTVDDALSRIQVIRGDFVSLSYPDFVHQYDLVLTSAVLEHVRDPQDIFTSCWHWLKPSGVTYHLVDLRDHNLAFQYPFEMLTFSDSFWNRWIDLRGGFHLNRWRVPDYLSAMYQVGFVQVESEPVVSDLAGLRAVYPRLQPKYRTIDSTTLAVLMLYIYGEKPNAR